MKHLHVHFDTINDDSHWVTGKVGEGQYEFYAKIEDEKNKNAVEKGRVTKLVIRKGEVSDEETKDSFWDNVVANFDRTWVIKPKDAAATEVFYVILDELERMPLYKDRIYGGSKIKKVVAKTKQAFSF